MVVIKWEGVIVGYPIKSVGYRVWDPIRGKIFNVGVPHVDENIAPWWWRKEARGGEPVDNEEIIFLHLDVIEEKEAAQVQMHVQVIPNEPLMPALVEDSSDDDNDELGLGDNALFDPLRGGVNATRAVVVEEASVSNEPCHRNRER